MRVELTVVNTEIRSSGKRKVLMASADNISSGSDIIRRPERDAAAVVTIEFPLGDDSEFTAATIRCGDMVTLEIY